MPNKNDLSAIKLKSKNALQPLKTDFNAISSLQVKAGRKPKALSDKESETVVLKLTRKELEHLKGKAGLVPLGTFIKHHLRNETDLLN